MTTSHKHTHKLREKLLGHLKLIVSNQFRQAISLLVVMGIMASLTITPGRIVARSVPVNDLGTNTGSSITAVPFDGLNTGVFRRTDYVSAGRGGVSYIFDNPALPGTAEDQAKAGNVPLDFITIDGIYDRKTGRPAEVTRAFLYWHMNTQYSKPATTAILNNLRTVTFNGNNISGSFIGVSFPGEPTQTIPHTPTIPIDIPRGTYRSSVAFRADVTEIVRNHDNKNPNGIYTLRNYTRNDSETLVAGVPVPGSPATRLDGSTDVDWDADAFTTGFSLLVFFDDREPGNDLDVHLVDGNDSNSNAVNAYAPIDLADTLNPIVDYGSILPGSENSDAPGWNVTRMVESCGGKGYVQVHVADGHWGQTVTSVGGVAFTPMQDAPLGPTVTNQTTGQIYAPPGVSTFPIGLTVPAPGPPQWFIGGNENTPGIVDPVLNPALAPVSNLLPFPKEINNTTYAAAAPTNPVSPLGTWAANPHTIIGLTETHILQGGMWDIETYEMPPLVAGKNTINFNLPGFPPAPEARIGGGLDNLNLIVTAFIVPTIPIPSDQAAGSVLMYPIYTSSVANPAVQNTRINITNTCEDMPATVHLFFIDGDSCSVADSYICLTPNQTMAFSTADVDPGITGYLIAIATDNNGAPMPFNYLIGDEYVKFSSGHQANLGAIAVTGLVMGIPDGIPPPTGALSATLRFDNNMYGMLPRTVAVDNLASRSENNDTLLVVDRIGGDLRNSLSPIGNIFGILFDQLENPYSWTASGGCQLRRNLSNSFPRTSPRYESVIPAGATGWMKFWALGSGSDPEPAIIGSTINFNPNAGNSPSAYNQGHNLHFLTKTNKATLTIPVFPSNCQ